jgi:hypothetical protein
MGGWASAQTCYTGYDYCATFTLPNIFVYDAEGAPSIYQFYDLSGITESNMDGVPYVNSSVENVFAAITNPAGNVVWAVPKLESAGGVRRIYTTVNRTDINGSTPSTMQICLNGTYRNSRITGVPITTRTNPIKYLSLPEFTQYYRRNWTFIDETTGAAFNFSGTNTNMNIFCPSLDQVQLNLSTYTIGQNIVIQTKEKPKYMVTVNSLAARIRQDSNFFLQDNYLLSKSSTALMFSVDLQDLTGGQYYKSSIAFLKPINNTMFKVDVQAFDTSNYVYPLLQNNTQYSIVLTTADGTNTRNIGPQWISDFPSTSKSVIVTTPDIAPTNMRGGNLNMTILSNYSTAQLACIYSSATTITLAEFYVYNVSSGGQVQTYYSNSTVQVGTLSYTADNMSMNYWTKCRIYDTGDCVNAQGGYCNIEQLVTFTNQTGLFKGMNLNLTSSTMGLSSSFLYSVIATVIILIIAGIFGAASYGTGGIVATILNGFFVVVGWLVEPWWYVTYLIVLAVLIKWGENRVGVAG